MTVCIAAMCQSERTVITASDRMVSMGGYFSGDDLTRKVDPLRIGWWSLIAGDNISPAIPIIANINELELEPETLANVSKVVKGAYRAQRLQQIEDEILSALGFTWEEFRAHGKERLTELAYDRITEQIRSYDLSLELLLCGFDPKGAPHIFTIQNPGKTEYYDKLGFWAIGSGSHQAIASLFSTHFGKYQPLEVCIAKVLAAKFGAESAMGVGKSTFVVMEKYGLSNALFLADTVLDGFRKAWEEMPKIPSNAIAEIKKAVNAEVESAKEEQPQQSKNSLAALLSQSSKP